jgi:hypothetical protein
MNPRDRRLRLRKSTVVNLNPNLASGARGGIWLEPSGFACTWGEDSCGCTAGCGTAGCSDTCGNGCTHYPNCPPSGTCLDWDCPIG